jgi:hypothetical protein
MAGGGVTARKYCVLQCVVGTFLTGGSAGNAGVTPASSGAKGNSWLPFAGGADGAEVTPASSAAKGNSWLPCMSDQVATPVSSGALVTLGPHLS